MFFKKRENAEMVIEQKITNHWPFRRGFFVYVCIIFVIVSFGVGVMVGKKQSEVKIVSTEANAQYGQVQSKEESMPEYLGRDVNFKIFWDVWNTVQNTYIDSPVGETKLFYGALNGMVGAIGDPYSVFMEPKKAVEFIEELQGKFEGIGAEIGIRDEALTVVSPLPESPAEMAGLRAADIILEIDGKTTEGLDVSEAVQMIRGDKGTQVVLKIYRPDTKEVLDITITRDTIRIVSVRQDVFDKEDYEILVDKKIGYIRITNFNGDTESRFAAATQAIILANPDGLILDLRSNPGGYLDTAINLANYWVGQGDVIVMEQFSEDNIKSHLAPSQPILNNYKTVVLINGGSASASEIVAGALQDYKLATVIGETSFGKGSVQKIEEFSDGSAVKLTIARWLTPEKQQIDKHGIRADIEVKLTVDDYNAGKDPQLERAVQFFVK